MYIVNVCLTAEAEEQIQCPTITERERYSVLLSRIPGKSRRQQRQRPTVVHTRLQDQCPRLRATMIKFANQTDFAKCHYKVHHTRRARSKLVSRYKLEDKGDDCDRENGHNQRQPKGANDSAYRMQDAPNVQTSPCDISKTKDIEKLPSRFPGHTMRNRLITPPLPPALETRNTIGRFLRSKLSNHKPHSCTNSQNNDSGNPIMPPIRG